MRSCSLSSIRAKLLLNDPCETLILLHGGFGALELFSGLVPLLRPPRQVAAITAPTFPVSADAEPFAAHAVEFVSRWVGPTGWRLGRLGNVHGPTRDSPP